MRGRRTYLALVIGTIALGLLIHLFGSALDTTTRDVLGDVLWAMMIVWWIGVFAPAASALVTGGVAYLICLAVELSQLYHSPALDSIRSTTLGHLVLGNGFDPRDLLAYAIGVGAALLLSRNGVIFVDGKRK